MSATKIVLDAISDEGLATILESQQSRCALRVVSRRWREIVEERFTIRHFDPPDGRFFVVDFEVNSARTMSKHLYCATFGHMDMDGKEATHGDRFNGEVTFQNWIPAYYRSAAHQRDLQHRLGERDTCNLWKIISKVRSRTGSEDSDSTRASSPTASDDDSAEPSGFLTVTEGSGNRKVIGKIMREETEQVLQVLDHRKNRTAERTIPLPLDAAFGV